MSKFYFVYYETRHEGDKVSIISLKNFNYNQKNETFTKVLNQTKSYLISLPILGEQETIYAEFNEIKLLYHNYDDNTVNKMMNTLINDDEWNDWLNYYSSLCYEYKSPEFDYKDDRMYAIILSDGRSFITKTTNTFNKKDVLIELY